MKLEKWALIAEIVSGIAVVVTLIVLVQSIRDNTSVTRAAVYSDMIEEINQLEQTIIADPDLSRLIDAYVDQDTAGLEEAERRRLEKMVYVLFRSYDKGFFNRRYGVVGNSEWARMTAGICLSFERATAFELELLTLEILSQEFRDYIDETCSAELQ